MFMCFLTSVMIQIKLLIKDGFLILIGPGAIGGIPNKNSMLWL